MKLHKKNYRLITCLIYALIILFCVIFFVCFTCKNTNNVICNFKYTNFNCEYCININYKNITKNNTELKYYANINLDISNDISNFVDEQLENFGGDGFDEILQNLGEKEKEVFSNTSFADKLHKLITGEDGFNFSSIIQLLISLLIDNFAGIVPVLALICMIAIISSLLMQIRGKALNKPLGDIIHFSTFAVIVVVVLTAVLQLIKITSSTLSVLKSQMEISFPMLLTLMAGLGAGSSVTIYQPLVAILCGAIMQLFVGVLLPIFSLCVIFNVIGNLTSSVKLNKFTNFLNSSFKYIIGFTFTIFSAFLAISGIVAGSYDSVSIRATKFAVKSYVPFVGGYLSDGFSLIMASSVLIKNAIGYSGLIIMFLTIISPILKIALYKLGLSLVSGIVESVADERVTNFLSGTAKSLSMLTSIILAFSFAYLICVGLIMCSSNVVV